MKTLFVTFIISFTLQYSFAQTGTQVLTGTLAPGESKTILSGGIEANTKFTIQNTGLSSIAGCLSEQAGISCAETPPSLIVASMQTKTVTATQLGYMSLAQNFNVRNLSPSLTSIYIITIERVPILPPSISTICNGGIEGADSWELKGQNLYTCPENLNLGVHNQEPEGRLHIGDFRALVFDQVGGNAVYGEYIGFNARINGLNQQFIKLAGGVPAGGGQQGGASIAVDYWGNMHFQMYDAGPAYQTQIAPATPYSPSIIFNHSGGISIQRGGMAINGGGLDVCGSIKAKEITVQASQSGWCDYVFEKDYKLMPLKELEAYLLKNKHLPEIPTQKEVEENGVNVGDMQTLQMKKIEELTLYIIQQQKDIEVLMQEVEKLKAIKN